MTIDTRPRSEREYAILRGYEGPAVEAQVRAAAGQSHGSDGPVSLDLAGFLKLSSNPNAMRKWVDEVQAVTKAHNDAKAAAEKATAESRREIATHDKARAEHAARLAADQAAFDKKCAAAWEEIGQREAETKQVHNEARVNSEAAAKLRADLQARIDMIKKAGAL